MKVLYVEDQPVNVALMEALFSMRPEFELEVATSGEEGLAAARREPPDLLMLDLHLPDCHGFELLERMRQQPALRDVPATAVTADSCVDLSGTSFLETWPKPLNVQHVLARLDSLHMAHLQRRQPHRSAAAAQAAGWR